MNRKQKTAICLTAVFFLIQGAFSVALADREEHKERKWYQKVLDWDHL